MPNELQNVAPDPGVLAYATPTTAALWLPPPAWLKRGVVAASLFILTLFLLGLPPLSGALDYTRNIPLGEVIEYAWAKGVRGTLDGVDMIRVAMFAPTAGAGLVAFLCVRGAALQRVAITVNVVLPAVWLGPLWPVLVVAGPPFLVAALAGRCDGEDWSEGFISYAAAASWTTLWLAVALVLAGVKWRRAKRAAIRPGE